MFFRVLVHLLCLWVSRQGTSWSRSGESAVVIIFRACILMLSFWNSGFQQNCSKMSTVMFRKKGPTKMHFGWIFFKYTCTQGWDCLHHFASWMQSCKSNSKSLLVLVVLLELLARQPRRGWHWWIFLQILQGTNVSYASMSCKVFRN